MVGSITHRGVRGPASLQEFPGDSPPSPTADISRALPILAEGKRMLEDVAGDLHLSQGVTSPHTMPIDTNSG